MGFERRHYEGIWVPLVTPFSDDEVDLEALNRLVSWLLERGVGGFLVLGSTGEAPHLSDTEALEVLRHVVRAVAGRVPVMAGCSRASTREAIQALDSRAKAGADAALILTPFYYRAQLRPTAYAAYYRSIADAAGLPLFVYSFPQITGVELEAEVLAEILSHDNVWGFKDSSAQGGILAPALQRRRTQGFVGHGGRLVEALEAGACGGILAVAHVLPELCVQIRALQQHGQVGEAEALQEHLRHLTRAWSGWTIAGVKAGLGVRGVSAGVPRRPLEPLPPEVGRGITAVVEAAVEATRQGR